MCRTAEPCFSARPSEGVDRGTELHVRKTGPGAHRLPLGCWVF